MARPGALRELWADVKESLLGFKRVYGWIEISVKDMDRAVRWYCDLFGLERVTNGSDPKDVHLGRDSGDAAGHTMITLVPIPEGRTDPRVDRHPILYTKRLEKVYADFVSKRVPVWPIQTDSGGNRFFEFEDSEGNRIEMCLEPGHGSNRR